LSIIATFSGVKDWTKWHERARRAKERTGKSDADLCEMVTHITRRKAGRAQVNHWFTGKREPTISQFMVLCAELGADPGQILFDVPVMPGATSQAIAKALLSDPTARPSYQMQEKRLKMRRDPAKARRKKRSPVTS